MRPLPSPPAVKFPDTLWPQERPSQTTVTNTYVLRLPRGRASPTAVCAGPRPLRPRRRENTHSPASSTCSIASADFWAPLSDDTPPTSDDESPVPVIATPIPKKRTKPANIIIPSPQPSSRPASFAMSPVSPLSPTTRINSPNARVRKLAKLTRTLGENVPVELVFPSSAAPYLLTSPTSPLQFSRLASHGYEPPTPTPARRSPGTTAVGLHYALGMHTSQPAPLAKPAPLPTATTSPPPFTHVFTMDSSSWDSARAAALTPMKSKAKSRMRAILPKIDTGRGTWRKKENTWSGEWNVEDMQELQVRLRRLR
ncbi:hypothetical protein C8F01DRAFT_1100585 [Mycena amicta]|nr:hypothetical protein C8F01DRAFT_1100585 [Mycena amicta]